MNGKYYRKNSSVILSGGDEVVFTSSGKHAYVSFFPLYFFSIANSVF